MKLDVLQRGDAGYEETARFVADAYRRAYRADIRSFMPNFVRITDPDGRIRAAMGWRDAADGPLYLEHYLDAPIEAAISRWLGRDVPRGEIAEVGNMAEAEPGDARLAIIAATAFLYHAGFRWVAFTGVTRLRNAFSRLGLSPKQLIVADENRLPPGERAQWGSYYKGDPVVCFGSIQEGHDNLQSLWATLRDTWAAASEAGEAIAREKHVPAEAADS